MIENKIGGIQVRDNKMIISTPELGEMEIKREEYKITARQL